MLELVITDEDFNNISETKKEEILNSLKEIKNLSMEFLTRLAERAVAPILANNRKIKDLYLDPHYEYNDEGYSPTNIMPLINGEYGGYGDLDDNVFEEIDIACAGFAELITTNISIDVKRVVARYNAENLDKSLSKKTKKTIKFKT